MTDFDAFDEDTAHTSGLLKWEMPGVSGHWVAEMDFGTAPIVEEALVGAIKRGFLGYMPQELSDRVKDATASVVGRRYGLEAEAENVRLASSVLDGLNAILGHMLKPGSRVIVPTPAYMPFLTLPGKFGHEVIEVPSAIADGMWQLDFDGIEVAAKNADLLILCNPWNPTGRVLTAGELTRLGEIATRHDLLVFNDEIHAPLVATPSSHICFAGLNPAFADRTVTAVAASKGFNLAGLHCAQMITTGQMINRFEAAAAWLNHPTPLGAMATTVAYEEGEEWLSELNAYLRQNVALIDGLLEGSSLSWATPQGTYMGLIDASKLGVQNPQEYLLEEAKVRTTPGNALGKGFEQYVRFGFASSAGVVRRSIERMTALSA